MATNRRTGLTSLYERLRTSAWLETTGRGIVALWVAHGVHESGVALPVALGVLIALHLWTGKPLLNQYYQNTEVVCDGGW